ncbi:retinoic acid receptor responder protein 1 [Zootoca vivipara]|uniref:retinoic acid receptor responder protein 1 n=1 Tax=Zootoca vivipara TaxID=8524 RepID=UPI001590D8E5|nr:retinoic acid receptor responder protein 1 [Zootoca vivipara]
MLRSETTLVLAAAALLALFWPAGGDPVPPKAIWQQQLLHLHPFRGSLPPNTALVRRTAQTALDFFNYLQSSPSSLRSLTYVKEASVKFIPGVERKYSLRFATKDAKSGQILGSCLATVWYQGEKPKPKVDIKCPHSKGLEGPGDLPQTILEDFTLFRSIRDGNKPSEDLLQNLAAIGTSYISWEKSSQHRSYVVTQVKNLKPWVRKYTKFFEVDYTAQLTSNFSENLSCHVRVAWRPGLLARVKYDCSSEDDSSESADGSGVEEGSANGVILQYDESNF